MSRTRRAFRCEGARGFAYGDLPAELASRFPRWVELGDVPDGEVLKAGQVWRFGSWVAKRTIEPVEVRTLLRRSAAVRAADASFKIAPVRTPQALLAAVETSSKRPRASWLVVEHAAGPALVEALDSDPRAAAALPAFFALMHQNGVLHGDLNSTNLLWNNGDWMLIDLESLRGPLHRLLWRRIAEDQWARVAGTLRNVDRVRPLFLEYARLMHGAIDPVASWRRIERRTARRVAIWEEMLRERRERELGAGADPRERELEASADPRQRQLEASADPNARSTTR